MFPPRFICDTQGMIQVSVVALYWLYGTLIPMNVIILPHYYLGHFPVYQVIVYSFFSLMTISSLLRATFTNPGEVPLLSTSLVPPDWSYCEKCARPRPSRAHHCSRCRQCVVRMDHHCPWINNCVGDANHFAFIQLLMYALCLSVSALVLCVLKLYFLPPCPPTMCPEDSFYVQHERGLIYAQTVMAVLMSLFMLSLSTSQNFLVALDLTTIETMNTSWMDALRFDANRPIIYRYEQLCGPGPKLLWLLPCRTRRSRKYGALDYYYDAV